MNQVQKFLRKSFARIGTPLATRALAYVESGDWRSLQQMRTPHPSLYDDATTLKRDLLVTELFRKCRLPGDTQRLEEAARQVFWASERACKDTNMRLARYQSNTQALQPADLPVMSFIDSWRKEVRRVVGLPSYVLEPKFSQGSTLSDKGLLTTIPDKMSSRPTCYQAGVPLYKEAFARTPQGERYPNPLVVRGNKFFTVPKDSFKDRGCCVEASAAVSLQLAVGARLKERYKRAYRWDLAKSKLRHQRLARLASAGRRDLSTIDLSNASDTIAYGVVQLVFPPEWLELLNSLRAPFTEIEGKRVRLEKFSSMGNGFTFELETILFQTLCTTICGPRTCMTFGDDMIVPSSHAKTVIAALRFFGFTPNPDKTFCEGLFRESCGGDFFNGVPVRAHYLKELPDEPQHWIALANGLRRADPELQYYASAWYFCQDQLPSTVRSCRGPKWLGDMVIHDPTAQPTLRPYHTITGGKRWENSPTYFYRVWRPITHKRYLGVDYHYRVATAAASLGVPSEFSFRDGVKSYKLDWVAAFGRADFFGWLD